MRIKRLTSLLLVLCLTLALGSIMTMAVDLDSDLSLTVKATDNFADEAEEADFNAAGVVVDLYKVASAAPITDEKGEPVGVDSYELVYSAEPYTDMDPDAEWEELAREAARLTFENDVEPTIPAVPVGTTIKEGLTAGLYLVIAHSADSEDYVNDDFTTFARSGATEFTFEPHLIALPTKNDVNGDGEITTAADDGEWIYDPTLLLKYGVKDRFGSLTINKTVVGFEGEPATFVFHIVDAETGGDVYNNYASIYFTGGTSASVTVDKVPAGVPLTVTEEYSGPRYTLISSDGDDKIVNATDPSKGQAYFTNERNNSGVGGNGINNNFTYNLKGAGDFDLTATPTQPAG